ncbi:MAG: FAD-binding oxidoreductase [Pirellulales bacterium]
MENSRMMQVADQLRKVVGNENILTSRSELMVYECDGFVIEKNSPDVVVFPRNTADVAEIVKICNDADVPFLPRGAGPVWRRMLAVGGGVMIVLTRMKRILEVNLRDRYAVVEPGVVNLWLTNHLKGTDLHYAPDPLAKALAQLAAMSPRTRAALTR